MERMEDWHFEYAGDPAMEQFNWDVLQSCDTLVLGRRTYDGFAEVWPTETGRVAERLNTMRKVLASSTVSDPVWGNTTVITGDLAARLQDLKNSEGGDVMTYGFGPVAKAMLEAGPLPADPLPRSLEPYRRRVSVRKEGN